MVLSMNMPSQFPSKESLNSGTDIACEGLVVLHFLSALRPSLLVSLLMNQLTPVLVSTFLDLVLGNISVTEIHMHRFIECFQRKHLGGCENIRIV